MHLRRSCPRSCAKSPAPAVARLSGSERAKRHRQKVIGRKITRDNVLATQGRELLQKQVGDRPLLNPRHVGHKHNETLEDREQMLVGLLCAGCGDALDDLGSQVAGVVEVVALALEDSGRVCSIGVVLLNVHVDLRCQVWGCIVAHRLQQLVKTAPLELFTELDADRDAFGSIDDCFFIFLFSLGLGFLSGVRGKKFFFELATVHQRERHCLQIIRVRVVSLTPVNTR